MKARWTYLGRAGSAQPRRRSGGDVTRGRLIDALQTLVERQPWSEITADLIAKEAGVAHGTLYRHFRDRWDVLAAARARRSAELERDRPPFDGVVYSRDRERERLGAWVRATLSMAFERPGLVRAFAALAESSEIEARRRDERRDNAIRLMSEYVGKLAAAGVAAQPPAIEPLSCALILTLQGVFREAAESGAYSQRTLGDGVADLFDRAIFGTL
jgi:AcrR family transcriptional regulator